MTNTNNVWKESDNRVEIIGTLVENNLELLEFDIYENGAPSGKKRAGIAGDISIRTAENEDHKVRLKQYQLTNAGSANKLYAGLSTIMTETVSLADLEKDENKDKTATRLKVVGDLNLNEFADKSTLEIISYPNVRGTFLNRIEVSDKDTVNKAEFDIVGLVKSTTEEMDREDEPTGRVKVSLYLPLYNSVVPMDFVVEAGKGAEYVLNNFDKNSTVRIYGDIVNFRKVDHISVAMDFGEDKQEEKVTVATSMTIKGGSVIPEDTAKSISPSAVKEKLAERAVYMETLKTRAKERAQNGNKGGGGMAKNGFGNEAAAKTPLDTPSGLSADELGELF